MAVAVALVLAGVAWLYLAGPIGRTAPGCAVTLAGAHEVTAFAMSVEQADNAATIAGVGRRLGMPDHAVSVAIATALQESNLRNLTYGDRDSLGLFQQRPSQGWGRSEQLTDTVYASTAFYQRLRQQRNWQRLEVTDAAQLVQRSAVPQAYAQWEPQARAIAAALTGEVEATLSCHDIVVGAPAANVSALATHELGAAALSGSQPPERGWALANWLVAHAARLAIDRVGYDGRTWTAESGEWQTTGTPDGRLILHVAPPPA
ncbi:MAG: hypothetical protein H0V92_09715 [Pseudonocardiales bacterium]|nr:hypothetical protein [Pseudonocardiales bacterium]